MTRSYETIYTIYILSSAMYTVRTSIYSKVVARKGADPPIEMLFQNLG